jgi:hypothetical protein
MAVQQRVVKPSHNKGGLMDAVLLDVLRESHPNPPRLSTTPSFATRRSNTRSRRPRQSANRIPPPPTQRGQRLTRRSSTPRPRSHTRTTSRSRCSRAGPPTTSSIRSGEPCSTSSGCGEQLPERADARRRHVARSHGGAAATPRPPGSVGATALSTLASSMRAARRRRTAGAARRSRGWADQVALESESGGRGHHRRASVEPAWV